MYLFQILSVGIILYVKLKHDEMCNLVRLGEECDCDVRRIQNVAESPAKFVEHKQSCCLIDEHHERFGDPCNCGAIEEVRTHPSKVLILCHHDGSIEVRGNRHELDIQILNVPSLPGKLSHRALLWIESFVKKIVWERVRHRELLDANKVIKSHFIRTNLESHLDQEHAREFGPALARVTQRVGRQVCLKVLEKYPEKDHGTDSTP